MTTQLDCSIGLKKESVFSTGVTVDQFTEFLSESLDPGTEFTAPEGMRVGSRVARAGRRRITKMDPSGSIEMEASSAGLGRYLEAAFGTVVSTVIGATAAYQHNFTPATTDLLPSYTIQKGIPPVGGGATLPHTFLGAMCKSLEISAKIGELVNITTEWLAKDMVTATAYAAPSYPSALQLFAFVDGALYLGNTITPATTTALATATGNATANITDVSVKWDNGLDGGGFNLGGAGKRTRKPVVGQGVISGSFTAEVDAATYRDAYLNNTPLTLLLNFVAPTLIATGVYPALQVHIPVIQLDGEVPKSNAGGVITQKVDFVGADGLGATAPIVVSYRSLDVTV